MTGKFKDDIKTEINTHLTGNMDDMKRINKNVNDKLSPTVKALEENIHEYSSLFRDYLKTFLLTCSSPISGALPYKKKILVCQGYREWKYIGQPDQSSGTVAAVVYIPQVVGAGAAGGQRSYCYDGCQFRLSKVDQG